MMYTYRRVSTADVNNVVLRSSAIKVIGISVTAIAAVPNYLKLYDQTSAPGTGDAVAFTFHVQGVGNTTTPQQTIFFPAPMIFSTGLGIRYTAGIADSDNAAVAAGSIITLFVLDN